MDRGNGRAGVSDAVCVCVTEGRPLGVGLVIVRAVYVLDIRLLPQTSRR